MIVTLIRANRTLLVVSTVGLGIVGSRVATDLKEYSSWFLVAAFAILLAVSDAARDYDERARELSDTVSGSRSRRDIVRDYIRGRPKILFSVSVGVAALMILGACFMAWYDLTHP